MAGRDALWEYARGSLWGTPDDARTLLLGLACGDAAAVLYPVLAAAAAQLPAGPAVALRQLDAAGSDVLRDVLPHSSTN